jgi:quercetin dioxygenase-like cupin family protein
MSSTATRMESRSLDEPDETRRPDLATVQVVNLGEHSIGRFTFEPGWTWAGSVKPIAGTDHCEKFHVGYCVSGRMDVWLADGTRIAVRPGDAYVIPPGHDGETVGDEAFVGIEFSSAATYAR